MKIAGITVLYHADNEVWNNICSYIDEIDCLYLLNNDKFENKYLANKSLQIPKIVYVNIKENKGLAFALKLGCSMAIKDKYDYVLTMDQDSIFEANAVKKMKEFILNTKKHYSIIGPNVKAIYYDNIEKKEKIAYIELKKKDNNREFNWIMTSGSLMCIDDYKKIKGFDESMFIAHVDIDIGIQFAMNGQKIIKLKEPILRQRFGNSKPQKILWKTVHPSYANADRYYYLFRNQKYLKKKYHNATKFINIKLWKTVVKIVLFEDDKICKLKMAYLGYKDGCKNKMGKINR